MYETFLKKFFAVVIVDKYDKKYLYLTKGSHRYDAKIPKVDYYDCIDNVNIV